MKNKVDTTEIPPFDKHPSLYKMVTKLMMYDICGHHNLHAACIENGQCRKISLRNFKKLQNVMVKVTLSIIGIHTL